MAYLIGIDMGSTNTKAVVFDEKGTVVASGNQPSHFGPMDDAHPDWVFYDPEKVYGAVCAALREAVAAVDGPIAGIAVTGMGMDGVPIDAEGNVLYPFISWRCGRTQPQYNELTEKLGRFEIFKKGGIQPLVYDTIFRMMWLKDNKPELYAKTACWLLIEDFINFKLCGVQRTDYSMASSTCVYDLAQRNWAEDIIKAAGVSRDIFPQVSQAGTVLGGVTPKAAAETGLKVATPVVLGGHDYHCGAYAVGVTDSTKVIDITGTFECIVTASEKPLLTRAVFDGGLASEGHVIRDKYGLMVANVSGGLLEWWRMYFSTEEQRIAKEKGISCWQEMMETAAHSPAGANGVYFLPHFYGSMSPVIDPYSRGAYIGMTAATTKADMLRALIEGLDYQMKDMLDAMENATGERFESIIAVGGATRNAFWMQNKADITGKPIVIPEGMEEATCLGAAMCAGVGVGVYKDEQAACSAVFKQGKAYAPDPERHEKYLKLFETYIKIQPTLRELNRTISLQ